MLITDKEFGEVVVRRNSLTRGVKFSIATSGKLAMSVPSGTTEFLAKRILAANRRNVRENLPVKNPGEQRARDYQKKILMKQARNILPYRLEYFAKLYGYSYSRCRLSHASTRWGSCSSNRTISLNIGLMKIPESLRDYVILHELAHLNHMDHSKSFWQEVALHDKDYKLHEKKLKDYSPSI